MWPADGSDFLFTSQKGGKLDRTQFFRVFRAVAESADLPREKRHPHVLKHSLASHLVAANVNLALIRQALGADVGDFDSSLVPWPWPLEMNSVLSYLDFPMP
jgi:site-specific recombinase XerD